MTTAPYDEPDFATIGDALRELRQLADEIEAQAAAIARVEVELQALRALASEREAVYRATPFAGLDAEHRAALEKEWGEMQTRLAKWGGESQFLAAQTKLERKAAELMEQIGDRWGMVAYLEERYQATTPDWVRQGQAAINSTIVPS